MRITLFDEEWRHRSEDRDSSLARGATPAPQYSFGRLRTSAARRAAGVPKPEGVLPVDAAGRRPEGLDRKSRDPPAPNVDSVREDARLRLRGDHGARVRGRHGARLWLWVGTPDPPAVQIRHASADLRGRPLGHGD